ncbi:MAG: tetratricopeptide repeat protein [Burkholderiales bacterium]
MTRLSHVVSLVLFAAVFTLAADARAAALEDTAAVRGLMDAGAPELALTRIEALQPPDRATAAWAEWEGLRCEVLARLNRAADLLQRVNALPAAAAGSLTRCFVEAARTAIIQSNPQIARKHLAHMLWETSATPAEVKAARAIVIESFIAERRGEEAFRSMLRYQQDYQPLDRAVADRFADALLDLAQERDAVNWLGRTDEVTATRLRLNLRGGVLSPEAVIKQARAALARTPDPAYWRAIDEAAVRSRNNSLHVEALERLLQGADTRNETATSSAADRLWNAYTEIATDVGNREQLLMGDDGAWADFAARRLGSDPFLSRAFYGFLAQRAQNADIRRNAQLQLAYSLSTSGLDHTALRLVQRPGFESEILDAQTRYLLGTIAAKRNEAALALKLWDGLAAPATMNAAEWQLTLARMSLQAGEAEASKSTIERLLAGRTAPSAELAQSILELAQEMLDLRALDAAETVFELMIPIVPESRAREVLFGLARTQELRGDWIAAAGSYLRSALLAQGGATDALASQGRLIAGLNLTRAGLKNDARAQFEWILKNTKEPDLVEAARRGLRRL